MKIEPEISESREEVRARGVDRTGKDWEPVSGVGKNCKMES